MDGGRIGNVTLDQSNLFGQTVNVEGPAGRTTKIEHGHLIAPFEQGSDQMAADEALASGDQRTCQTVALVVSQGALPSAQRSFRVTRSL